MKCILTDHILVFACCVFNWNNFRMGRMEMEIILIWNQIVKPHQTRYPVLEEKENIQWMKKIIQYANN